MSHALVLGAPGVAVNLRFVRQGEVSVGGLRLAYLEDGPPDGPLALCLHGFPDSAYGWRHLLPALADAGYRAVAPWLRGYAPSGLAPDGRYTAGAIAEDADGLHAALGGDSRAVLVGHDWGALAAYGAAAGGAERWSKLVTMAVPPMSVLGAGFLSYDQLKRSFYIYFFQTPFAEMVLGADDLAFLDRLWADWSPGYDAGEDLSHVKDALRAPEHLAAALATYRAMFQPDSGTRPDWPLPQPWLYLHGRHDGCIGVELAPPGAVVVEDAGHFCHVERPDVVNAAVLEFLQGNRA